jgi:hypothetical protein
VERAVPSVEPSCAYAGAATMDTAARVAGDVTPRAATLSDTTPERIGRKATIVEGAANISDAWRLGAGGG